MAAEFIFQVGKKPVNCIGGVWDFQIRIIGKSEQPRQIRSQASVCASQAFVSIEAFSGLRIDGAFV